MTWSRRGWMGWAAASTLAPLQGCEQGPSARWPGASTLPSGTAGGWVADGAERGHALRDGRWRPAPPDGPVRRVHTLILGAGIAGLSAARTLRDAGLEDLVLLDLQDQAGGNARSHVMQGQACPLGAHYLPVPGEDAHDMAGWLQTLGVIRRQQGRWVGEERHLCHSPQERLFMPDDPQPAKAAYWHGHWQEGLLPLGPGQKAASSQAQHARFAAEAASLARELGFSMPTTARPWHAGLAALDAQPFDQWLNGRGYTDPALRWMLDYACRDDYGAGASRVSAWAGIQYFASRAMAADATHESHETADAVLTWPEGNAWLVRQLAEGLGARWQAATVACRVQADRHEVLVDTWSATRDQPERWAARHVIMAVPLFVAARLWRPLPPALLSIQPMLHYAPWLVSNLALSRPLIERAGAPLSWDNVAFTPHGPAMQPEPSLGYVHAQHQSLAQPTGPVVLTHYWALGGHTPQDARANRQRLWTRPWAFWADAVVSDLARIHPDLPAALQRIDLMRWGHGMVIPVPGLRGHPALHALHQAQGRVHLAHSDLSAYSVFEEAFTHGARAARQVLAAVGMPRRMP